MNNRCLRPPAALCCGCKCIKSNEKSTKKANFCYTAQYDKSLISLRGFTVCIASILRPLDADQEKLPRKVLKQNKTDLELCVSSPGVERFWQPSAAWLQHACGKSNISLFKQVEYSPFNIKSAPMILLRCASIPAAKFLLLHVINGHIDINMM